MLTKKEIIKLVEKEVIDKNRHPPDDMELPEEIKYESIESFGGEGKGDEVYEVLEVTHPDGNFFIICHGSYSSYEGCDWSYGQVYECEPYMKQIRDWKPVK